MSRHHVLMIAQPAGTAFLFDDVGRQERRRARASRAMSEHGVAMPRERRLLSAKAPATARWVERRAMKRTR
jgi:hypothetical protein